VSVAYVSGSPKAGSGTSLIMLERVRRFAPGEIWKLEPGRPPSPGGWEGFLAADAVVVSFPLYVDHLPAHLLESLEEAAAVCREARQKEGGLRLPRLYALINNGFYEPEHSLSAAGALKLFCRDSGMRWSGALMAGGGPVVSSAPALFGAGVFPFGRLGRALMEFARKVSALEDAGETGVRLPVPRRLYVFMANTYWRALAWKNGVPRKSLYGPALPPGGREAPREG
jgi:hypothetical protein